MVGDSLLLCNVVNRANQVDRLYVCQYVVFILKLILSYLPVHLINSLPSSLLKHVAVVELRWEGERQLGLPGWAAKTYVTGNVHFVPNVVHECMGEFEHGLIRWAGKYDNISFNIKITFLLTWF